MSARAAGYIRISALMGREQGSDLLSDEIQRQKIEAWARLRDAEVVAWYEDIDRSGRKGKKRPEFERLLNDARAGRFDAIVVYNLSRLGRHAAGVLDVLDELDDLGVTFASAQEAIDYSTAAGRLMRHVLVGIAEYQSEAIAAEWRATHAHRRRNGDPHRAKPMLGYRVAGGTIVGIDPRGAEAVRLIFEWYLEGAGKTLIARRLDAAGFAPVRGQRFTASTVDTVLRNATYAGLIVYRDPKTGVVERHDGSFEAIIPRLTFQRAERERRRRAGDPPPRARAGLLSGLLRCVGCGSVLTRDRRGEVVYYRCASRARSTAPCKLNVSVRADFAEEYVWGEFERLVVAVFMSGRYRFDDTQAADNPKHRALAAEAQQHRERAEALQETLTDLTLKAGVLGSQYDTQAAALVEEIDAETAAADAIDARLSRPKRAAAALEGFELAVELPLEQRQHALKALIERVDVHPSPRKGAGQRALIPERLALRWNELVDNEVQRVAEKVGDLAAAFERLDLNVAPLEALTKRKPRRFTVARLSDAATGVTATVETVPR